MQKYLTIIFAFAFTNLNAQLKIEFREPLKIVAEEKVNSSMKEGSILYLTGIGYRQGQEDAYITISVKDKDGVVTDLSAHKIDNFHFEEIDNTDKVWNMFLLENKHYISILKKGFQYSLRQELNNDAIDFVNTISHRFFEDQFLEDYLYTLLTKIHPGILIDNRPGNIYVKVLKDAVPNAFILPNGCIVISTGLLSTLQSEDELVGVLVHEVAHFVLDHPIMNSNEAIDRKKRAEFWAGFATVLAAGADIYLASNNKNYIPGVLTASTAVVATVFAGEAIERLGVKYKQEQEIEADNVSKLILRSLKYDTLGLSVALQRIKDYCIQTGDYLALTSSGTHPSISSRINNLGKPTNVERYSQSSYLKKVSFINSYSASVELWGFAHHESSLMLAERNISNGVATESDYLVKAVVKMRLSNTKESNEEVLALLNKAKSLNITPYPVLNKHEGIAYIRLDKKAEAKRAFQAYLTQLTDIKDKIEKLGTTEVQGVTEEIIWTKKMIFKVDSL